MNDRFKFAVLNGNTLKLIALIAMTVDHVGEILFPQITVLRIIGRLAYPIFAFMIAEGCFYTKHKYRYFFEVLGIGALCQIVYFVMFKSLYMNIMIVFAFSILIIFAIQKAVDRKNAGMMVLAASLTGLAFFLSVILPNFVKGLQFDYGFVGIILPVAVYLIPKFKLKLAVFTAGLIVLAIFNNPAIQFWSLLSLPLLMLYNGERGKIKVKHFFYIYYPAHMVAIWLVSFCFVR